MSDKVTIRDLNDGKCSKPNNVTMDDAPTNDAPTDKDTLSYTSVLEDNDGHNTLNDSRNDRTQALLLIEVLRQIKEINTVQQVLLNSEKWS